MSFSRASKSLVAAFVLLASPHWAAAQDSLDKQRKYDHDQCANQCQIVLDKQSFICLKATETVDKTPLAACRQQAQAQYEACTRFCPADPRKEP